MLPPLYPMAIESEDVQGWAQPQKSVKDYNE
jgi:hypothetical protein